MRPSAVRRGIAANAGTIAGLTCYGYVPHSITEPAFVVGRVDVNFDQTFGRGHDELLVTCTVFVSKLDDDAGQALLDDYLAGAGPTSLKAAIEEDEELGGACDDLHVQRVSGYGFYDHNGTEYFGAQLTVRVIGTGG